jgi:hypothetical protein
MKKAIVSAIYGDFDNPVKQPDQGVDDYILFTDNPKLTSDFWHVIYKPLPFGSPRGDAKYIKTFMWLLPELSDYDELMWIDGCLSLHDNVFAEFGAHPGFAVFARHPFHTQGHDDVYRAIDICREIPKYADARFDDQVAYLESIGFPHHSGIHACCRFLTRRAPELVKLTHYWWSHNLLFHWQDQLSLPVAIYQSGVSPTIIPHRHGSYHHEKHLIQENA